MLAVEKTALKVINEAYANIGTKAAGTIDCFAEDHKLEHEEEPIEMNGTGGGFGNTQPAHVAKRTGTCTNRLPIRCTGSQVMEAGVGAFLQASGFKTTDSKTFTLYTGFADQSALSIDEYRDGNLVSLWGAMFNPTFEAEVGGPLYVAFDGKGLYTESAVNVTYPSFAPSARAAMILAAATLTYDSYAFKISRVKLNLNNQVILRPDAGAAAATSGYKSALITNSKPTFEMDPEDVLVETYNFYAKKIAIPTTLSALPDLTLVFSDGTDKVTFTLKHVQIIEAKPDQRDGLRIRRIVGRTHFDGTNPQVTIVVAAA
jgi:hypothetical protein